MHIYFLHLEHWDCTINILNLGRSHFMFPGSSQEQRRESINNRNEYVNITFKHKYDINSQYLLKFKILNCHGALRCIFLVVIAFMSSFIPSIIYLYQIKMKCSSEYLHTITLSLVFMSSKQQIFNSEPRRQVVKVISCYNQSDFCFFSG